MVVTEFVFVQLKQDASLRDQALPVLQDMVKEVEKSPANVRGTLGRVATEQSIDVSQEARPVLLAEWKNLEALYALMKSGELQAFRERLMPSLAGPPIPEAYETDVAPWDWAAAPMPKLVKIELSSSTSMEAAQNSWDKFRESIAPHLRNPKFFSGRSLNVETETFIGAMGTSADGDNEATLAIPEIKQNLEALQSLDGVILVRNSDYI